VLILGLSGILVAHDILPSYHLPRPCNGGLREGFEFLAELLIAALIIETVGWTLWYAKKIVGSEASNTSTTGVSKLVFVPGDSSLALLLGVVILVFTAIAHSVPNPCEQVTLSWREAVEYLLLAYAFLVLASIVPRL
jgi:hypothetical protein